MDEAKKALQAEVVAVKQRWAAEIKLVKAAKEVPTAPLPLAVSRTIEVPESAKLYDIDDLTVKLWVDSLEAIDPVPVRVEITSTTTLPSIMLTAIAAKVDARWRAELRARGAGKGFMLEKILAWAEGAFVDLIVAEPTVVDPYEGVDENGMTIRRYAFNEPAPEPVDVGDDDESEYETDTDEEGEGAGAGASSIDPDDIDARVKAMKLDADADRAMRIRLKAEAEAERLYKEERRREHEALGEDAPKQGLGKKAQQKALEEKRQNQGKRLRKAGAKHNKFDAEAAGKTKNKKNGLMH